MIQLIREFENLNVEPFGWTATATFDNGVAPAPLIPIAITIWDHDSSTANAAGH